MPTSSVGVLSLVMLSVLEAPVSDAACRSMPGRWLTSLTSVVAVSVAKPRLSVAVVLTYTVRLVSVVLLKVTVRSAACRSAVVPLLLSVRIWLTVSQVPLTLDVAVQLSLSPAPPNLPARRLISASGSGSC